MVAARRFNEYVSSTWLVFGKCCIQLLLDKIRIGSTGSKGSQCREGEATLPLPEPRLDSCIHSRTDIFYKNTQNGFVQRTYFQCKAGQLNKSVHGLFMYLNSKTALVGESRERGSSLVIDERIKRCFIEQEVLKNQ